MQAEVGTEEIEERLAELERRGLSRRLRLVSGPQGPTVLLDGQPVLLLCSNNYLGLADHPRVREAAAAAAMRWGVGAGASRLVSGTMMIHRRLEERLAAFKRRESALLFGSGYLANAGVISALARPGDVVFSRCRNPLWSASLPPGCPARASNRLARKGLRPRGRLDAVAVSRRRRWCGSRGTCAWARPAPRSGPRRRYGRSDAAAPSRCRRS